MNDEERKLLSMLVRFVVKQQFQITALEETLYDAGLVETSAVREHYRIGLESLGDLPAVLDLATCRRLLESESLSEEVPTPPVLREPVPPSDATSPPLRKKLRLVDKNEDPTNKGLE